MNNIITYLRNAILLIALTGCQANKQAPAPVIGYEPQQQLTHQTTHKIKHQQKAVMPITPLPQGRLSGPSVTVIPIQTPQTVKPSIPSVPINNAHASTDKLNDATPDYIIVKSGDGLGMIAQKYQIPSRHIIAINDLQPPYNLLIDQKLWLKDKHSAVTGGLTKPNITPNIILQSPSVKRTANMDKQNSTINKTFVSHAPQSDAQIIGDKTDKKLNQKSQNGNSKLVLTDKNSDVTDTATATAVKHKIAEPSKEKVAITDVSHKDTKASHPKFLWPLKGKLLKKFGTLDTGFQNDGINIEAREGDIIQASFDGVVAYVGNELQGFGNLIMIKHHSGWMSAYAHCSKTIVKRGDQVKSGDKIALAGHTGNVRTPQLHFELRRKTKAVDPLQYLE